MSATSTSVVAAMYNHPTIPKILHQLWIGDASKAPRAWMQTWETHHNPLYNGWTYKFWNEARLQQEGITFRCQRQIDAIAEINGKADIIRWELLERFGGVFVDADSVCLRPLDPDLLLDSDAVRRQGGFAAYENENIRQGLVATGTMGFIPGHPLVRAIVDRIASGALDHDIATTRAWFSVGPGLLTRMLSESESSPTASYNHIHIFPSYYFLPTHFMGPAYMGHGVVFAYQEWSTAKSNYGDPAIANTAVYEYIQSRAPQLVEPPLPYQWVSLNMVVHDTPRDMLRPALESIRAQVGYFGIEVVVVTHNCSASYLSDVFVPEWERIQRKTRFCRWIWKSLYNAPTTTSSLPSTTTTSVSDARQMALMASTCEWVFVLDSDDVMMPTRIATEWEYGKQQHSTDKVVWIGSNAVLFDHETGLVQGQSQLPEEIRGPPSLMGGGQDLETWIRQLPVWMANHSSIAFRRQDAIDVGGYWPGQSFGEDYSLLIRLLLYNVLSGQTTTAADAVSSSESLRPQKGVNMAQTLVRHRLHRGQTNRQFTDGEKTSLIQRIAQQIVAICDLHLLD